MASYGTAVRQELCFDQISNFCLWPADKYYATVTHQIREPRISKARGTSGHGDNIGRSLCSAAIMLHDSHVEESSGELFCAYVSAPTVSLEISSEMVRSSVLAFAVVAVASTFTVSVDAHTNMAVPAVKFPDGFYNDNNFYGKIDQDGFPETKAEGLYFNTQKINKVMESYSSLRELIMKNINLTSYAGMTNTKACGLSLTTGDKQPIPDAIDFPWGHPGPCEVWCDNHRIFYNDECQGNNVGKVPIDKTKCKGVNLIQAMYVGVHVAPWEVYTNCAPMEGGTETDPAVVFDTAASASGGNNGSPTTKTPAVTTKAPATPIAPAADEYDDDEDTPTTTTPAPTSALTSTPAASKTNCKRRARQ